jgi:hypothetical protein
MGWIQGRGQSSAREWVEECTAQVESVCVVIAAAQGELWGEGGVLPYIFTRQPAHRKSNYNNTSMHPHKKEPLNPNLKP